MIGKSFSNFENEDLNLRHTKESALAFYLEYNYNRDSYRGLRKDTEKRNSCIYPSEYIINKAMEECQPSNYRMTEIEVSVSLQDMLNKTAERLCEAVALEWDIRDLQKLKLVVTLGFDSSSGHTNPHQTYANSENEDSSAQQSLFVTSMIVIALQCSTSNAWLNPTPQSVRFCRPLRIAFEKENDIITKREFNRLNEEIKNLFSHSFTMSNSKNVKVTFNVYQTLFDGKCVNTIVGNSATTRCPMCLRTSHQFNNFDDDFAPIMSSLKYGLGLLHCEIKCFEHLLHISYRLCLGGDESENKTWDVRKPLKGK